MPKIVTFTGASGTGKSAIVGGLLQVSDRYRLVQSTTTRDPRESDMLGEYDYVCQRRFGAMNGKGEFLWKASYGGNSYGTPRAVIDEAMRLPSGICSLMILVPQVVPILISHVGSTAVLPFLVRDPSEAVRRERMQRRGDTPESIERRLDADRNFDRKLLESSVKYVSISNDHGLVQTVYLVREYLE